MRVLLALASIVTLLPGCEGAGRMLAERENLRLLAGVALYPGAAYADTRTDPVYGPHPDVPEALAPVVGYVTSVAVTVPRGTRMRDVRRFYESALASWACTTWFDTLPPPAWTAVYISCSRGAARIGLNTENLLPAARFELSVAARSGG